MTVESTVKPIVVVEKLNFKGVVSTILDARIWKPEIHIGTLSSDGKTVEYGKKSITGDQIDASPGDKVITHEI